MIKMNFKNQLKDDDEQLIRLLKEQTIENPSNHLIENTMEKLMALQSEKKFAYKPLKTPLYIMVAIAFLLVLPFFIQPGSNSSYLNPLTELISHPTGIILKYMVWCWFAIMGLWVLALIFPIQFKSHLNLSKP